MQRIAINSSAVAEIGYDPASLTLEVRYQPNKNGVSRIYRYAPVQSEGYARLQQPGISVGRELNSLLKDVPFVDVTGEEPVSV